MNIVAKKKFIETQGLFKRMSHEICIVIESYYIWRTLTFARSIPEVGQEQADKNAKLMAIYKDFFIPTEQSHLHTFIIGLMKFFDKNPRALSVAGLAREIERNKDIFTVDIVRSIYPDLARIGAVEDNYVPINQEVINSINQLRENHETLITNLKNIRDKQCAHTDMETIKGTFVPLEIETLIEAIQETLNGLSGIFDLSSTTWDHLKHDSIGSTQFLLKNLERGGAY